MKINEKIEYEIVGDCWECISGECVKGYMRLCIKYSRVYAHRYMYEMYILKGNSIPDGLFVLHSCDNKKCINPDHLFLGTKSDNNKDRALKGRSDKGTDRYNSILDENKVKLIRLYYELKLKNQIELAEMFNVSQGAIYNVVSRKRWKHIK